MTFSVGLSAAFVNVLVLLGLAVAAASSRLSQLARLVISTFAFICPWPRAHVAAAFPGPQARGG